MGQSPIRPEPPDPESAFHFPVDGPGESTATGPGRACVVGAGGLVRGGYVFLVGQLRPGSTVMERNVALWIDHRQAVIASVSGDAEDLTRIVSGLEKHVRYSASEGGAEDSRDRRFE